MHNKTREKVIRRQAKNWLDGFGIPWHEYDAGLVENHIDPIDGEQKNDPTRVIFTHRGSGQQIVFGSMWVNEDTGEVMRAGSNSGNLVY